MSVYLRRRARPVALLTLAFATLLMLGSERVVGAGAAASGTPRDLALSSWFTDAGHSSKLAVGITYQASSFPLKLRVTPPDGSWGGAQWKTSPLKNVAPFYGWVVLPVTFTSN